MAPYISSDITASALAELHFPHDAKSQRAQVASRVALDTSHDCLQRETLFQISFLENTSHSLSEQLDELLAVADIESVGADRQRYARQRVVRHVNVDNDDAEQQQQQMLQTPQSSTNNATSTFKLTLQDCHGNTAYAIELEKLSFLSTKNLGSGFPIQLGSKVLVKRGAKMFRGVLMLEKSTVEFLGGLVPEWNRDLQRKHIGYIRSRMDTEDIQGVI